MVQHTVSRAQAAGALPASTLLGQWLGPAHLQVFAGKGFWALETHFGINAHPNPTAALNLWKVRVDV